jgi:hypothetical protein
LRIVSFLPGVRYGDRHLYRLPAANENAAALRICTDREQHTLIRGKLVRGKL